MKRILLTGIAASFFAGSAFAADLPARDQAPFYPSPPPLFTWTGFYAGINGGLGLGGFTGGGGSYFSDTSGGLAGGTIGYNYQGGPLVVGIEADLDWADIHGSGTPFPSVSGAGTIDETNSVRARLGFTYDRALIYATGGYAGGSVTGRVNDFASAPNLLLSESHYLNGYAVGVGVEYSITQRVSVKAEYLFNSLSSHNYFGGTADALNAGVNYSILRAGLNYHF